MKALRSSQSAGDDRDRRRHRPGPRLEYISAPPHPARHLSIRHSDVLHGVDGRRAVACALASPVVIGAAGTGVLWLAPRVIRRNWNQVSRSDALKRALKWNNSIRLRRSGGARSNTAILTHVGRRSGRSYQIPVGAYPYGDGFVVALIYRGTQSDWCRNVIAAGTCTLTWKGHTYELGRPEVISMGEVIQRPMPVRHRALLRVIGVREFLWLQPPADQPGLSPDVDVPTP